MARLRKHRPPSKSSKPERLSSSPTEKWLWTTYPWYTNTKILNFIFTPSHSIFLHFWHFFLNECMSCYNTRIRGNLLFLEKITLSISICTCDVRSAVTHMSVISSSTSSLCVEDKKKIIKTRIDRNPSHARPDKRNVNSIRPSLNKNENLFSVLV
jgi:hypothetical protein